MGSEAVAMKAPRQSHASYHADTSRVSHSSLEVFRQSRRLYFGRFISKEIPAPPPTPQMAFGSAFHAAVLEPDRFADEYAIAPEGIDRRTKSGKAEWSQFEEAIGCRTILDAEQGRMIGAMRDSLFRHPVAKMLLDAEGVIEQPITWDCPRTGIACKARPDWLFPAGVVFDLKTASDPSPAAFQRSVVSYGYGRQAPFYLEGLLEETGDTFQFLFVVVGKEPPHDTAVYELDADALAQGARENNELLRQLKGCLDSDQWESPWSQDIQTLSLPRWALARDDNRSEM